MTSEPLDALADALSPWTWLARSSASDALSVRGKRMEAAPAYESVSGRLRTAYAVDASRGRR